MGNEGYGSSLEAGSSLSAAECVSDPVVVSLQTAAALMESSRPDVTGNSYTSRLPGRAIIRGWEVAQEHLLSIIIN